MKPDTRELIAYICSSNYHQKQSNINLIQFKKSVFANNMSASIDALAMAGVDCAKAAIDFDSDDDYIPPYLLARNQALMDEKMYGKDARHQGLTIEKEREAQNQDDDLSFYCELKGDEETVKKNLRAWAKAVASWLVKRFTTDPW